MVHQTGADPTWWRLIRLVACGSENDRAYAASALTKLAQDPSKVNAQTRSGLKPLLALSSKGSPAVRTLVAAACSYATSETQSRDFFVANKVSPLRSFGFRIGQTASIFLKK